MPTPTDLDDTGTGPNGHADPRLSTGRLEPLEPLPWHEPKRQSWVRRGWRVMTGRPARAPAGESAPRPAPLTVGVLITIGIFLVGEMVGAMYWAGHISAIVEQHEKTLSVAGVAALTAENASNKERLTEITAKYNRLLEYEGVVQLYESKIRELLVSNGVRSRDLPPPPQLPQE